MPDLLSCSKCEAPLSSEALGAETTCPVCQSSLRVEAFPALLREAKIGGFGERVLMDGQSTCFYHPAKKAAVVCDGCGRFLCGLCDIELGGEHLCSICLEGGRGQMGKEMESGRFLYEDVALGTAVLGLLLGPFGVISSSIAIFLSLRHWNKPQKIGAVWRWKKVIAILLALGVIGLWGAVLVAIFLT